MNDEWLKNQCNRYVNGMCQTLYCLKRGGYPNVKDNPSCEPHEILCELQSLRKEVKEQEKIVDSLVFNRV